MKKNKNIIVLGSGGIICKNLKKIFNEKKIKAAFFGSKKANLNTIQGLKFLKKKIKDNDIIIFVSAKAPAKNYEDFYYNIDMVNNFILAIKKKKINYLIYISSDAVYGDYKIIDEKTDTDCGSIHGKMHLTREQILQKRFGQKLCILRPTLIFGKEDNHRGYGPNQFYQKAREGKNIILFGKGEEKRDHIYSKVVANYIYQLLKKKKTGIYNLASGNVVSFYKLACWFKKMSKKKIKIIFKKRKGPMPHKGYRSFNVNLIKKTIKGIKLENTEKNLSEAFKEKL